MYILKQEFQYTTSEGVILTLKVGTKIDRKEGDEYVISQLRKEYRLQAIIVENNPNFFEKVDLKSQLTTLCKAESKRTAPKMAEILVDFINKEVIGTKDLVEEKTIETMLEACRLMYLSTKEDKWLVPFKDLNWVADAKGVSKK